ncbi:MAG: hypothetical protein AAF741_07640 [Bacteroidota bacterium]
MIATESPLLFYGFIVLTLITLLAAYWLIGRSRLLLVCGVVWLVLQAVLASSGFYAEFDLLPPRLVFPVASVFLVCSAIGFSRAGRQIRDRVSLEKLHYLHAVRILVELVFLHGLFEMGLVAKTITYQGTNFDIYAGLTGPLVGILVFRYKLLPRSVALIWNILACTVLISVFVQATLSAPFPIQRLGFDQSTTAIFYFPFIWLPTFVAPVMILVHFISIRKIMDMPKRNSPTSL